MGRWDLIGVCQKKDFVVGEDHLGTPMIFMKSKDTKIVFYVNFSWCSV